MKHQNGFTLIEGMLVLIAVTLISFAGWYVWNSQQDNSKSASKTSETTSKKAADANSTKEADETESWTSFSPKSKLYSIKLPDGWTLTHQNDECDCIFAKSMTYKKGTPAVIETTQGGRDLAEGFSIFVDSEDLSKAHFSDFQSLGTFQTNSGLEVKKYYFEQTTESDGLSYAKGTKEYVSYIVKDGKGIEIRYSFTPSQENNLDLVNKAIQTLK